MRHYGEIDVFKSQRSCLPLGLMHSVSVAGSLWVGFQKCWASHCRKTRGNRRCPLPPPLPSAMGSAMNGRGRIALQLHHGEYHWRTGTSHEASIQCPRDTHQARGGGRWRACKRRRDVST